MLAHKNEPKAQLAIQLFLSSSHKPIMLVSLSCRAARPMRCTTCPRLLRCTTFRTISTRVRSIHASEDEVCAGKLTERNLEQAVRSILEDGLVVVENAIAHHHLDKLNTKMFEDSLYLSGLGEGSPFNYNKGNLQQDAPPTKKYFEPSIFLSKPLIPCPNFSNVARRSCNPNYFDSTRSET